jgi:hypothetical protein
MNRRAVQQPSDFGPSGPSPMHAIGAPELSERRGSSQKHQMSTVPRKLFDRFESRPP